MVTPYMKNEDIVAEFRRDWSSNLFDRIVNTKNWKISDIRVCMKNTVKL